MSKKKTNVIRIVGIAALLLAAGFGVYSYISNKKSSKTTNSDNSENNDTNSGNSENNENNDNNDNSGNSENNDNNDNNDNSGKESDKVEPPKPQWYQFAHPGVSASALSKEQIEVIFDNILIPFSSSGKYGYITNNKSSSISSSNPVVDIVSVIYIPTGEIITDIDKAFYKDLLNTGTPTYSTAKVNGNNYISVVIRKK